MATLACCHADAVVVAVAPAPPPRCCLRPLAVAANRAVRRRVRLDGPDHARLPALGRRRAPRGQRLPRAAGRRTHSSRRPPSPPASGAGSPTRTRDLVVLRTSVGRYGDTAILGSATTRASSPSPGTTWPRNHRPDRRAGAPPARHPLAGRPAAVPYVGHQRAWPESARSSRNSPASRCAARPTTASASRPASPAPTRLSTFHPLGDLPRGVEQLTRGDRTSVVGPPGCRACTAERENRAASDDASPPAAERIPNKGKLAKDLNEVIRYTSGPSSKLKDTLPEDRAGYAGPRGPGAVRRSSPPRTSTIRGTYDCPGLRADADLMIWWHAETVGRSCRRRTTSSAAPGSAVRSSRSGRTWRCTARPSSTRAAHPGVPGRGDAARTTSCVYPFVRSCDWYLLPDDERRRMLADHGKMARGYPGRARQHRRRRSRWATTSGSSPSRPTTCTASSTSCATCAPPRPAATCARRSLFTGRRKDIGELVAGFRLISGRATVGRPGSGVVPWDAAPDAVRTSASWSPGSPSRSRLIRQASASVPGVGRTTCPGGGPPAGTPRYVDAVVRPAQDAARPRVPLGHQHRARQPPPQLQRPLVGRRRVPFRGQDQRRRQLTRRGAHVQGLLPGRPPVGARQVRPGCPKVSNGARRASRVLSRSQTSKSVGQGVVALHGRVHGVGVLRPDRASSSAPRLADQRLRIALQVRRQRLRAVRPVVVVVPGLQERPATGRA